MNPAFQEPRVKALAAVLAKGRRRRGLTVEGNLSYAASLVGPDMMRSHLAYSPRRDPDAAQYASMLTALTLSGFLESEAALEAGRILQLPRAKASPPFDLYPHLSPLKRGKRAATTTTTAPAPVARVSVDHCRSATSAPVAPRRSLDRGRSVAAITSPPVKVQPREIKVSAAAMAVHTERVVTLRNNPHLREAYAIAPIEELRQAAAGHRPMSMAASSAPPRNIDLALRMGSMKTERGAVASRDGHVVTYGRVPVGSSTRAVARTPLSSRMRDAGKSNAGNVTHDGNTVTYGGSKS